MVKYAENESKTAYCENGKDAVFSETNGNRIENRSPGRRLVTGINCSAQFAGQEMVSVGRRFGNRGTVTAYHGVQSFVRGEVSPEKAHRIGVETACILWESDHQVLVATHLNTDCIHNHFVVNAFSFRNGEKLSNKMRDHYQIREVSDRLCERNGLSVLPPMPLIKRQSRGSYWKQRREMLERIEWVKEEIEYCLSCSSDWDDFADYLESKGYQMDLVSMDTWAEGWSRGLEIEKLGLSRLEIDDRLRRNETDPAVSLRHREHPPLLKKRCILLDTVEKTQGEGQVQTGDSSDMSDKKQRIAPFSAAGSEQLLLDHFIQRKTKEEQEEILLDALLSFFLKTAEKTARYSPDEIIYPDLRHEMKNVERFRPDLRFLQENGILTLSGLNEDIQKTGMQIAGLQKRRKNLAQRIRRGKDPVKKALYTKEHAELGKQLELLRELKKREKRIRKDVPKLIQLLKTELRLERQFAYPEPEKQRTRERDRGTER